MPPPIRVVVGLGNPGSRYARTRHNAGFRFADALAAREGGEFRALARFSGEVCEIGAGAQRLRLLKPSTYMNRSGDAVAALARFYRYAPGEILVAHDEIDLAPGVLRLKRGGGHAGHNGLRDIAAKLGSTDFARLRIGVGHPGSAEEVTDYVLRRAPAAEQALLDEALDRALSVWPWILGGDFDRAMNELHRGSAVPPADADRGR